MFKHTRIGSLACGIALATLLSACGGSDNGSPAPDPILSPATATAFSAALTAGLANLTTYAGLTSAAVADLYDGAYLDGGVSKADVLAALQSEAQAVSTSPDFPSFAQVSVSNISISNCDAATLVCSMSGTLNAGDADATSVSFTTQVKLTDKARLYGDQSKG